MTGKASERLAFTFLVFVLTVAPLAGAQVTVGPVINPENGHSYYLLAPSSWPAAEAQAVSLGGHLVTVRSTTQSNWLSQAFSPYSNWVWIGLNDAQDEGVFVWTSGEHTYYSAWMNGSPAHANPGDDFVAALIYMNAGIWVATNETGIPALGTTPAGVVEVDANDPCVCDINGDHAVDLADVPLFAFDYQSGANPVRSDFNRDGNVDLADIPRLAWGLGTRDCP